MKTLQRTLPKFETPRPAICIKCLLASLLVLATLPAQRTWAMERNIGFLPLEIYTFEPGSSRLLVTDINGDGLDDVVFANNHVSRLEILLRKTSSGPLDEDLPKLEERFEDHGIIVDQRLQTVRIDDLDGDGRKDIATFGNAIGLQLRYQQEDGSFGEPQRVFLKDVTNVSTIQLVDMNGDGSKDILVCHRDQAELLWNSEIRPFQEKKVLPFSSDNCYFGETAEINGDGTPDLVFYFNTPRNPLQIRYGKGEGLYGIEQPVDVPPRQFMVLLRDDDEMPQIGTVLQNRLAFRMYGFEEKEQPPLMATSETAPVRIALEGTSKNVEPAWLAGDFNGDKLVDLLVAAPALSRLHLYLGTPDGLNPEPKRIDTLSDVDSISRLANGDVLVVSKKEKIAAVHSAQTLAQFPQILQSPGEVIAGCALESDNEAWLVCKDEENKMKLVGMPFGEKEQVEHALDIRNEPSSILPFRLPEGKTGIILFMPYSPPKMMLVEDGQMTELTSESFRVLSQVISRANILLDQPGDGAALTVTQGAIARRFEWKNDHYEAIRQFNPENPRGELIAACGYHLVEGSDGTMFFDRNSKDLVYFSGDSEEWGTIHIDDADQTIFNLVQLYNGKRDAFVLLDRTGINVIMGNGTRLEAVAGPEYTSPSEDPLLAYAIDVKLGAPPEPMIALVDPANRTIEIVKKEDGELKQELAFEVFLISDFADMHNTRTTEPHDIESGDLNGDGIGDLVVLSHDKLLIYLGE